MSDDVVIVVRAQDQASGALRQVHAELQRAGAAAKSSGAQASASASGWAAAGTGAAKAGTQARDAGGKFVAAGAAAKVSAGTAAAAATGWARVGLSLDAASKKAVLFRNAYRDALDDRHIRAYDVAGAALIGTFALSVAAAAGFEKQLSSLRAVSGATAGEMEALSAAALKAGADTVFSASEAAKAQTELVKAGVTTSDILGGGLRGSLDLAAAGGLDLARAAEIAATSMNMFNLAGRDVSMIADTLASGANKSAADVDDLAQALSMGGTVASQMGMSIQETTGLLSLFADEGIRGSDAGTMLKTMLLRLNPSSKEAADLIEKLGLSAYDAQGSFIGMQAYAGKLQTELGGLDEATRNAYITTLFGNDAWRSASILMQYGEKGVQEYTAAMTDQGAAARMAGEMMDNLAGDVEALRGSIETGLIKSGSGANEMFRTLTQTATGAVNTVSALPAPIIGVGLAIVGLSGATLILTPRVMATVAALRALSVSSGGARSAVGRLAVGLGAATAATFVLSAATAALALKEETSRAIDEIEDLKKALAAPSRETSLSLSMQTLQSNLDGLKGSIEGLDDLSTLTNISGLWKTTVTGFSEIFAGNYNPTDWLAGTDAAIADSKAMLSGYTALIGDLSWEMGISADEAKALADRYVEQGNSLADLTGGGYQQASDDIAAFARETTTGKMALDDIKTSSDGAAESISAFSAAMARAKGFLAGRAAVRSYKAALDAFDKSLKDNGKTFDDNTDKGRANSAALDGIAEAAWAAYTALDQNGNATVTNTKEFEKAAVAYYTNARALGMTAGAAADLTAEAFGAKEASEALGKVKANPTVKGDVKDLEGKLARVNGKIMQLGQKKRTPEIQVKIDKAQEKATEIKRQLDTLNGKRTDPKVTATTAAAEEAIGRTTAALTNLDGQRATVYIDVVQNRPIPNTTTTDGRDTATTQAKAGFSMPGKALHRTLAAHHSIASSLGGGFRITNLLTGGGGKGRGSGDHQSGRAVDVQGPRMGDYIQAVRAQGGFAEMHGSGRGRHVHAVMGDTASPARVTTARGGDTFQFYWYGTVSGTDESTVKAWVRDAVRQVERSKRERSAS